MREVYLDNSATTLVCDEAAKSIYNMLTVNYGNPSSLHKKGVDAQAALENSREIIAKKLGCEKNEIFFTSGGTEANNTAVFGAEAAGKRRGRRIVTTMIEHPSILEAVKELENEGFEVVRLKPDGMGYISEKDIFEAVNSETILVSIMMVNNEVGSIQPIRAAVRAVRRTKAPALVHCDAVQGFGKLPINVSELGVDLMSISAHKIHGPKGTGALYIRKGTRIVPRAFGGGQEKGIRSGTEAVPMIVGFGEAVRVLPDAKTQLEKMKKLRDYAASKLSALGGVKINSPEDALPYILNISVPGIRSETMLHYLSENGIYVSSGSACSKGAKSHVLSAMELDPKLIDSSLRISFSRYNSAEDVDLLAETIEKGRKTLAHAD